jgi:plastocyanin
MSTKKIIAIVVVVVIVASIFGVLKTQGIFTKTDDNVLGGGILGPYENPAATIVRTNDGYEPRDVTISAGEAVSFVNNSDDFHWPASDIHPTHSIYSEFDPDAPVAPGETWTFIFEDAGEWQYHDHIRANLKGIITVIE